MTRDELTQKIANTIGKLKVLELSRILTEQQFDLRDLIDITFHPDKPLGFRAAWLLENMFLKDPAVFTNNLEYLIERLPQVTNPGCQRHYAKILMHASEENEQSPVKKKLNILDLEPVVEQLFDWMIDSKVKIAVKVFAGWALLNLRFRYPWVADELPAQLEFLMRNGTAAIQSAGRKMMKELSSAKSPREEGFK
ncbi:hypothetical protein MTO98_16835 [Mucilaginibacter sp. SMC90]|uniref:hypothetical protein n=1 Tax=Mucilaginibacter sp. SMC90 TaxID=2929803 RepID=UPI001FB28A79|nr:hypothetical protein [Mucilaginibacter sp. SMC90]UOE52737.1 hypothetical protein MTO98_16835 [Mucilaginibacter sp. SMC90]